MYTLELIYKDNEQIAIVDCFDISLEESWVVSHLEKSTQYYTTHNLIQWNIVEDEESNS